MKKLLSLTIAVLSTFSIYAQCESAYFPFTEGVSYEMTSYNSKDKEQGKVKSTIEEGALQGNTLVIQNEMYDKKGKLINEGEYEVTCENGTIKMDMEKFIPDDIMDQYKDMEMTVEGDFLEIPGNLEPGQSLPDATGKITVKMAEGPMNMNMTMDMKFTARNVEKMETITTPAGTFETYKITQTTITTMKMMGMNRETTFTSASWVAKGVGTVRSETYDKKGELDNYSLLTSFTK